MHQPLTLTPAPESASTPVPLGGAAFRVAPGRARAGLAASASLHLAVLMAAWRLATPLSAPPAMPASYDIVFQAPSRVTPAVRPAAQAKPVPTPATLSAPVPARSVAPAPRADVHRVPLTERPPVKQAAAARPHVAAPRQILNPGLAAVLPQQAAAPALPAVELPHPTPTPDPQTLAALETKIDQAVSAAKSYPPAARRLGMQGRSRVSFSYRDGVVTNVALARSSSADMLDRAALDAVRRAAYPAAPPALAHKPLQLAVWLDFSLRQADW